MEARQLIAENIRRARIINKSSISEFSARTKIAERKIKEYESGDKFPSMQDLCAISKETKLSLDFFFDHIQAEVRLRGNRMSEREKKQLSSWHVTKRERLPISPSSTKWSFSEGFRSKNS